MMMSPLQLQHNFFLEKVLLLLLVLIISQANSQQHTRLLLDLKHDVEDDPITTNSKISSKNQTKLSQNSSKNQTKLIKPSPISSKNQTKPSQISSKNETKPIKPSPATPKNQTKPFPASPKNKTKPPTGALKNQTKLIKSTLSDPPKNKIKPIKPTSDPKTDSSAKSKLNSTKISSSSAKSSSDLPKITPPKNKNSSPKPKSKSAIKALTQPQKPPNQPDLEDEEDDDLISGFRDLPYKFHETFVPDLEKFSETSKIYLTNYNKEITKGFKPYVGNKYAPTVAPIASFAFIIIPLILVSLVFNRITAYFSIQKILIFIQFYLAMYFAILALSALVTGVEPLRFFYSASRSTYVGVQILQTLGYVLYLLLLLMYLIVAFSSETGLGVKLLGLAQTFVGFAVGLHYYVMVFHRAVLHQPPKSSWMVHALYATCFVVICLLGTAGRRKKAYLEEDGEEGKKS